MRSKERDRKLALVVLWVSSSLDLHNRRFMNQARRTRYFAQSAKRVRSAKCRVRLALLMKRLLCRLGLPLPADSSKLQSAVPLRNILASMENYHLRMFVYGSRQFVFSRNLSARKFCQGVGLCHFLPCRNGISHLFLDKKALYCLFLFTYRNLAYLKVNMHNCIWNDRKGDLIF